jgi:hypothetical protein
MNLSAIRPDHLRLGFWKRNAQPFEDFWQSRIEAHVSEYIGPIASNPMQNHRTRMLYYLWYYHVKPFLGHALNYAA